MSQYHAFQVDHVCALQRGNDNNIFMLSQKLSPNQTYDRIPFFFFGKIGRDKAAALKASVTPSLSKNFCICSGPVYWMYTYDIVG